jgi:diadenosine tetraphosphate (Ap4A) HIT family hydrolase
MDLADLTASEAASLGVHIRNVDQALRQYWSARFEKDPIQRVYVAYFHESVFGFSDSNAQSQEWHMHFHIIPRTVELGRVLRGFGPDRSIRAWSIPEVVTGSGTSLPPEYEKTDQNMSALIAELRRHLATTYVEG